MTNTDEVPSAGMLPPHDYVKPTKASMIRTSALRNSGAIIAGQSKSGRSYDEISQRLRSSRLRSVGGYETVIDIQTKETEQNALLSKVDQVLEGLHQHASSLTSGMVTNPPHEMKTTTNLEAMVRMVQEVLSDS